MASARLSDLELKPLQKELNRIYAQHVPDAGRNSKRALVEEVYKVATADFDGNILRPFYAGSAYESLSAGGTHDFDIMIYINIRRWNWKSQEDGKPGFATITYEPRGSDNERPNPKWLDPQGRLSNLNLRRELQKSVDKTLVAKDLRFQGKSYRVTRSTQGPAVTLNVNHPDYDSFSIDLVVSVTREHIGSSWRQQCDYVAKPMDKTRPVDQSIGHYWRMSYSVEERNTLTGIDKGNKIHRKTLQIFKVLKKHHAQLRVLPSYVYKNVLLYLSLDRAMDADWSERSLAARFMDFVTEVHARLEKGSLPVYYNKRVDLLAGLSPIQVSNIRDFLKRTINKGVPGYLQMLKIIPEKAGGDADDMVRRFDRVEL